MLRLVWNKDVNNSLEDCVLLVYLCAAVAHQTGTGFDAIFVRLMFVVYVAVVGIRILNNNYKLIINGYVRWQFIFMGYILVSCLWGNPDFSTYYFTQFIQILFLAVSLSQRITSVSDVHKCLKIYYIALIYMVILLYIRSPASDWGTENIGSAIGLWRNTLGISTATGFLLGMYFFQMSDSSISKLCNMLLAFVFGYVSFSSGSRKAVFMVFAYFILYCLLYKKRNLMDRKTLFRAIWGILVALTVVYVVFRQLMNSNLLVVKRLESMINILLEGGSGNEGSIQERSFYIEMAKKLFFDHFLFGSGSNGFAAYMQDIGYSHIAYCHNNFWEILSTLGLVGFVIYYSMHIISLCRAFPMKNDMRCVRELATTLWVSLFVIVIFGWWFVYYPSVSYSYLFVLAYMVGQVHNGEPDISAFEKQRGTTRYCNV